MMAMRHFHEFGTTREQLAWIALNARRNAALNPKGVYRDPMTLDDYLGVRMVSSPLCLYDCDVPADGSTAVIVSRADASAGLPPAARARRGGRHGHPRPPVVGPVGRPHDDGAARCGARRCGRAPISRPADVDVAELYDGFSFITLCWLEALGFCGKGEGGPFIDGGRQHRARRRSCR